MQHGSNASLDATAIQTDCPFCQRNSIATYILIETSAFLLVTDHAPLVEGHLLIIPKAHYACYGAVPAALDGELQALKGEVSRFFARFYAPVVFWEHGVFRQTVFHAHLHCFPFGEIEYNLSENLHARVVHSQDDIRTWYASHGEYFYLKASRHALLFMPNLDDYMRVVQKVLRPGASARGGYTKWRSPQQRYEEGGPLIKATKARWQTFQQQGVYYADKTSPR